MVSDASLLKAVREMESGLVGVSLGDGLYKKRVQMPGRGKRSGGRMLLAYHDGTLAIFVFGFSKNERVNLSLPELRTLRLFANKLLGLSTEHLEFSIAKGELKVIGNDS